MSFVLLLFTRECRRRCGWLIAFQVIPEATNVSLSGEISCMLLFLCTGGVPGGGGEGVVGVRGGREAVEGMREGGEGLGVRCSGEGTEGLATHVSQLSLHESRCSGGKIAGGSEVEYCRGLARDTFRDPREDGTT